MTLTIETIIRINAQEATGDDNLILLETIAESLNADPEGLYHRIEANKVFHAMLDGESTFTNAIDYEVAQQFRLYNVNPEAVEPKWAASIAGIATNIWNKGMLARRNKAEENITL